MHWRSQRSFSFFFFFFFLIRITCTLYKNPPSRSATHTKVKCFDGLIFSLSHISYEYRHPVPRTTPKPWRLQVAKALNADMILVANGGLGSAYDELELNRGICEKYGIKVRGVLLNKVMTVMAIMIGAAILFLPPPSP